MWHAWTFHFINDLSSVFSLDGAYDVVFFFTITFIKDRASILIRLKRQYEHVCMPLSYVYYTHNQRHKYVLSHEISFNMTPSIKVKEENGNISLALHIKFMKCAEIYNVSIDETLRKFMEITWQFIMVAFLIN